MKTITKFILGFPMLALASGSIAFGQVQFEPDFAAEAAAPGPLGVDSVTETMKFDSGSQWKLTVIAVDRYGLVIKNASFQKSPTSSFINVLRDGRQAEIFVPYHAGSPRFFDITIFPFEPLELDPASFPPPLQLIGRNRICKEVRNYLAWMDHLDFPPSHPALPPNERIRYGQEVVYFSVLKAGNYDYIMEWTFRDDGAILVRTGSTGPKFPPNPTEGHIHNFTWRLNIDLNGAGANSAYWTSHSEDLTAVDPDTGKPASTATDNKELISIEGSRVWNPEQFNTLQIVDARLKNRSGRPTGYELIPMRSGTARHSEPFTQADFWVTQNHPEEIQAIKLPSYILAGQSTINKDLVIWYTGSAHHENNSRDEDFDTTPVIWVGFQLEPQNLFDGTPFYPKR